MKDFAPIAFSLGAAPPKPSMVALVGCLSLTLGWLIVRIAEQWSGSAGLPPPQLAALVLPATLLIMLTPNWLLLIVGVPFLMLAAGQSLLPPLLSLGKIDLQVYDLVIMAVLIKIFTSRAPSTYAIRTELYHSIGAFLVTGLAATLVSYYRFHFEVFGGEMVALMRFTAQASVFVLMLYAVRTPRQLELSYQALQGIGYLIAGSIYINVLLFTMGIQVGGVQTSAGITRYFGPLGDQVGFLLPLFLFKELLASRVLRASFFGGALLLTGTRGALIALGVGLVAFFWEKQRARNVRRLCWISTGIFLGLIGLGLWCGWGGMLERFLDHNNVDSGLTQRFSTVTLAVQVFMDNFLLGVGFSGFRFAAIDYGAENLFFRNLSYSPLFVASTGNQYLQVATDAGVVGLAAFLWMMRDFLRTLKRAEARVVGPLQEQTKAGYLWLLSLAIGNQSAAWLLPGSLISYLVWVSLGLATVTIALTSRQDRA